LPHDVFSQIYLCINLKMFADHFAPCFA
jgi:hypothetical protein